MRGSPGIIWFVGVYLRRASFLKLSNPCKFQSLGGEKGWQQLDAKEGGGINPPWPDFHLSSEHWGWGSKSVFLLTSLNLPCGLPIVLRKGLGWGGVSMWQLVSEAVASFSWKLAMGWGGVLVASKSLLNGSGNFGGRVGSQSAKCLSMPCWNLGFFHTIGLYRRKTFFFFPWFLVPHVQEVALLGSLVGLQPCHHHLKTSRPLYFWVFSK